MILALRVLCNIGGALFAIGAVIYAIIALTRVFHPFDTLGPLAAAAICIAFAGGFFFMAHALEGVETNEY